VRDGVAMKRRQHQSTPVAMHVLVEYEQRVVAEQPDQDQVRFAGMKDPRVAGEHRLDVGGIGEVHHLALQRFTQREHVAVAALACGQKA